MRELLAALSHEQWSGWMRYLFGKSQRGPNGTVTLPASLVSRWERQMNTAYHDLPECEKQSDRNEADKTITILEETE